jgi:hypothetical protein
MSLMLAGAVAGLTGSPAGAQQPGPSFGAGVVRLDGNQEVPPADLDGRGTFAYIAFDHTLCYVLTARRIEPATMAHIHAGARGVNGPIAIALIPPTPGFSFDCIASQPDTTPDSPDVLLDSELAQIIATPAQFYANVHNAPFPGGAIRGQLR